MNKKVFIVGVLVVLLMIFIVPKEENNNIDINNKKYSEGSNKTAVEYLKEKANNISITNYEDGNKGEMYTFSHAATNQTPDQIDYRYIGDKPNNYVYFNCDDELDTSTCELWRIIGVFDVDDENGNYEQKIKIVRNDTIYEYHRWTNTQSIEINDWSSTLISNYLNNGDYWYSISNGAKQMISNSKYYLGAMSYDYVSDFSDVYGETHSNSDYPGEFFYNFERGNTLYTNNYYWLGKVGLIYPSDYIYTFAYNVDNQCFNRINDCNLGNASSSWIYNISNNLDIVKTMNHMITPWNASILSIRPDDSGDIGLPGGDGNTLPTVYLKNNTYIIDGNGSLENPYILSLDENITSKLNDNYVFGDEILVNNEKYFVVKDSNSNLDYVLTIKADNLSKDSLNNYQIIVSTAGDVIFSNNQGSDLYVIKISKCKIDGNICDECLNLENNNYLFYKKYNRGDKIIYRDEEYYVIENSSSDSNYITLLKANPLNSNIINNSGYATLNGEISFYDEHNCPIDSSQCDFNYTNSNVKKIVDDWSLNFKDDLIKIDGFMARIPYYDEILKDSNFEDYDVGPYSYLVPSSNTPNWITLDNIGYWTMRSNIQYNVSVKVINYDKISNEYVYDKFYIRPVINLKKSVLSDGIIYGNYKYSYSCNNSNDIKCSNGYKYKKQKIITYNKEYKTGDKVIFKDELYYVVDNSSKESNYVTLFKVNPLTINEIYKFGTDKSNNLFVNKNVINILNPEKIVFEFNDNVGGISYYNSENCRTYYEWNGSIVKYSELVDNGCNIDYDKSDVKKVVDNWANTYKNDLIKINGYYARLITLDELLTKFGFVEGGNYAAKYITTSDTPKGVYNRNYNYWTMSPIEDSNEVLVVDSGGRNNFVYGYGAVKPVINVDKCAIGGCSIEEIEVEDGCIDEINNDGIISKVIVEVANTLKYLPQILIIISIILIIGGCGVLGYNYIKSRKERK